jgi:hypothetical protein
MHCVTSASHKRFDTYIRVILSVYLRKSNLNVYLFGTQAVLILLQTFLLTLSLLLLAGPFYDD